MDLFPLQTQSDRPGETVGVVHKPVPASSAVSCSSSRLLSLVLVEPIILQPDGARSSPKLHHGFCVDRSAGKIHLFDNMKGRSFIRKEYQNVWQLLECKIVKKLFFFFCLFVTPNSQHIFFDIF